MPRYTTLADMHAAIARSKLCDMPWQVSLAIVSEVVVCGANATELSSISACNQWRLSSVWPECVM